MHANHLIHASSPYLLQHAHNPVSWYPWGEEALQKARDEDKPIIVSIGYSACHWCHVMERESFENEAIAQLMNEHFVCIKVDREERPDIDQVYMEALHAMGLQGGWPLNVFLLPDQRPFYGGTYFPAGDWGQLLQQIGKVYKEQYNELANSAAGFMQSIATDEVKRFGLVTTGSEHTKAELHAAFEKTALDFDPLQGGMNRAPKFPMPVIYTFLLREYAANQNQTALDHTCLTLDKMALGGIYDQAGGGFARYATDTDWFVPHFEKMLYDNGQLTALYSEAYQATQSELYKETVYQTIDWLEREMLDESGGFYSALDADSEGEEGKFYLWKTWEFRDLLGPEAALFIRYYNLSEKGNWEPGKNILFRSKTDEHFAKEQGLELSEWKNKVQQANRKLLKARANRPKPGLDDKILAGWNGLMSYGLAKAYEAFHEPRFLQLAENNMRFVLGKMRIGTRLYRNYKGGKAGITAYLEDYAAVIQALVALYEVTFDENWLHEAKALTEYTIDHFADRDEGFFFFTDDRAEKLIARKKEIFDNVIPSSNSLMAHNLYRMGILLNENRYTQLAVDMANRVKQQFITAPRYLTHWGSLFSMLSYPTAEIVTVSKKPAEAIALLGKKFLPNKVVAGKKAGAESSLALLQGRDLINDKDTFYLCHNKVCQLPVNSLEMLDIRNSPQLIVDS